ncbi:pyrroloquinoline quinone precursor peptide PqqA [Spelaeicoccus albus]|uniref:Coenzyme PQQ synthesis protein A n=1 Tax=Spelaeicoccus albus TaxID=1280376 RepID=A0A7Z0A7G8_9MICO|nr:pyrroloquinoline quinone precursor peptide PqqA [Spelaeicoccus albus]NYI65834.1 coenzyme PQQ precursor peptide PqqA [Spelaeicoccus albus]
MEIVSDLSREWETPEIVDIGCSAEVTAYVARED